MAVCAFGLQCGKTLALPTWLTVASAYSVAAIVSMQLPAAHGDNCRVATTITATTLAAAQVSIASAGLGSIVLWLCPPWALWWTKDTKTDNITPAFKVTSMLRDVLRWMDANDNVLPARHRQAIAAQNEEDARRNKYD